MADYYDMAEKLVEENGLQHCGYRITEDIGPENINRFDWDDYEDLLGDLPPCITPDPDGYFWEYGDISGELIPERFWDENAISVLRSIFDAKHLTEAYFPHDEEMVDEKIEEAVAQPFIFALSYYLEEKAEAEAKKNNN